MESNGECMINDAALTPGGGSRTSGVILVSYQVHGEVEYELNMKQHE